MLCKTPATNHQNKEPGSILAMLHENRISTNNQIEQIAYMHHNHNLGLNLLWYLLIFYLTMVDEFSVASVSAGHMNYILKCTGKQMHIHHYDNNAPENKYVFYFRHKKFS
jgi:hypothetical protein